MSIVLSGGWCVRCLLPFFFLVTVLPTSLSRAEPSQLPAEMDIPLSLLRSENATTAIQPVEPAAPLPNPSQPEDLPSIDQPQEESQNLLRFRGVDLMKAPWFVSSVLDTTATAEQLAVDGTPTSPMVMLKVPRPFDQATLFTVLVLEDPAGLAAILTLAGVDGTDQVFVNGREIGATEFQELTQLGTSRRYFIPAETLRSGTNILALRLQGVNGSQTIGLTEPPLVFQFVPAKTAELWADGQATAESSAKLNLQQQSEIALGLIRARFPSTSPAQWHPRPWTLGRFATNLSDGLPTVEFVSALRMANRTGPTFEVSVDHITSIAISQRGRQFDGFIKPLDVQAVVGGQAIQYRAQWSPLYPGIRLDDLAGNSIPIRIQFAGAGGEFLEIHPEERALQLPKALRENVRYFLCFQQRSRSIPMMIAVYDGTANSVRAENHIDLTIKPTSSARPSIHAWYPLGIETVDLRPGKGFDLWRVLTMVSESCSYYRGQAPENILKEWLSLGSSFPNDAGEFFRVEQNRISIVSWASFPARISSGSQAAGVTLPPIIRPALVDRYLSMAASPLPRDTDTWTSTGLYSFSGRLSRASSPVTTVTQEGNLLALSFYELPWQVPPTRILPKLSEGPSSVQQIIRSTVSESLGKPDGPTALQMLGNQFSSWLQVFYSLDPEVREKGLLEKSSLAALTLREGPPWVTLKEPLSGATFPATDLKFGGGEDFESIAANLGRYLHAMGQLDLLSPDMSLFAAVPQRLKQRSHYARMMDDWEWMSPGSFSRGYMNGSFEELLAVTGGHLATYRIMSSLSGESPDNALAEQGISESNDDPHSFAKIQAAYFASRAIVNLTTRLHVHSMPSRGPNETTTQTVVLSYMEGAFPNVEIVDAISDDFRVYETLAGVAEFPDAFEPILAKSPETVRGFLRATNRMWQLAVQSDGSFYDLLSSRQRRGLLGQVYLRARLRTDSAEDLMRVLRLIEQAESPAPVGLAQAWLEVSHRDLPEISLHSWHQIRIRDFQLTAPQPPRQRRNVELVIERPRNLEGVGQLKLRAPGPPQAILLDGAPIPLTDQEFFDGILKITLRTSGKMNLVLRY